MSSSESERVDHPLIPDDHLSESESANKPSDDDNDTHSEHQTACGNKNKGKRHKTQNDSSLPKKRNTNKSSKSSEEASSLIKEKTKQQLITRTCTKRSWVWNYFQYSKKTDGTEDRGVVKCNLCGYEIVNKSSTTNMGHHITNKHGILNSANNIPDPTPGTETNSKPIKTIPNMFIKESIRPYDRNGNRSKTMDKYVARWIIKDLQPLSAVEGEGFVELMGYADPRYKVPVRKSLHANEILPLYQLTKRNIKDKLFNYSERVCFTTDGWSSLAQDRYISLTCHYVHKETFILEKVLLETKHMPGSHTGENLLRELNDLTADWGLSGKNPCFVTDNASNIMSALNLGDFDHIGCLAHTIHLAVEKGLSTPEAQDLITKCKKLVAHFKHSPLDSEKLNNALNAEGKEVLKVIQSCSTRWNSILEMSLRALKLHTGMSTVLLPRKKHRHLLLTPDEITRLESLTNLLIKFKDVTELISSETYPTISLLYPIMAKLKEHVYTSTTSGDSDFIAQVKIGILKDLETRYKEDRVSNLIKIAVYLDPRFRRTLNEETDNVYNLVLNKTMEIVEVVSVDMASRSTTVSGSETASGSATASRSSATISSSATASSFATAPATDKGNSSKKKSPYEELFGIQQCIPAANPNDLISVIKSELDRYQGERQEMYTTDILNWWKIREHLYPNLVQTVKVILCMPATSVPSERVFSTAGYVVNKYRTRLTTENVNIILFLNANKHLLPQI